MIPLLFCQIIGEIQNLSAVVTEHEEWIKKDLYQRAFFWHNNAYSYVSK